jgi:hypothetical protein
MKKLKIEWENPSEDKPTEVNLPDKEQIIKMVISSLELQFKDKIKSYTIE